MTKLRITVTKEILERSKMCGVAAQTSVENCAIALAVRDVFPKARVWMTHINTQMGDYGPHIILPVEASVFISEFDDRDPEERVKMNPIAFEIEIPDEIIEKINIDELKPLLENHPNLALV